jgi:hypothetical protein
MNRSEIDFLADKPRKEAEYEYLLDECSYVIFARSKLAQAIVDSHSTKGLRVVRYGRLSRFFVLNPNSNILDSNFSLRFSGIWAARRGFSSSKK